MFSYRSLAIFSQVSLDPIPKKKKKGIIGLLSVISNLETVLRIKHERNGGSFITTVHISGILITFKEEEKSAYPLHYRCLFFLRQPPTLLVNCSLENNLLHLFDCWTFPVFLVVFCSSPHSFCGSEILFP